MSLSKTGGLEAALKRNAAPLTKAVQSGSRRQLAKAVGKLAADLPPGDLNPLYLRELQQAVLTGDWAKIGERFANGSFSLDDSVFLLTEYVRKVNGKDTNTLTLIVGEKSDCAPKPISDDLFRSIFGKLHQPVPALLALDVIISEGSIGNEDAFLAPGGHKLPDSERGPAILSVTHHLRRYNHSIKRRIRKIFAPPTAKLLLSAINDRRAIVQEYYQHEAGHAAGAGLATKLEQGLIDETHQAGWEEYKTDVAGFRLGAAAFSSESTGKLVACTLLIRWGIDFCRPGAPTADHDAISSLLILDRLLQSGEMYLTGDRMLALRSPTFEGLFAATAPHRAEAEDLVRLELACAEEDPRLLARLYEGKCASPKAIDLHREFIARCAEPST